MEDRARVGWAGGVAVAAEQAEDVSVELAGEGEGGEGKHKTRQDEHGEGRVSSSRETTV